MRFSFGVVLAATAGSCAVSASPILLGDAHLTFEEFVERHGRAYAPGEEAMRAQSSHGPRLLWSSATKRMLPESLVVWPSTTLLTARRKSSAPSRLACRVRLPRMLAMRRRRRRRRRRKQPTGFASKNPPSKSWMAINASVKNQEDVVSLSVFNLIQILCFASVFFFFFLRAL